MQDHGIVVLGLEPDGPVSGWKKHIYFGSAQFKFVSFPMPHHLDSECVRLGDQAVERSTGRQQAYPQLFRTEIFQHCGHASDVVGVAVGNRDRIKAGDAARPQVGGNYIFSEVELGTGAPDGAAGVDE